MYKYGVTFHRGEIKEVIDSWADWLVRCHQASIPRDASLTLPEKLALAVIGVRRSGKTFAAANLLKSRQSNTFYMNFEDPFFIQNNSVTILDDLISVFTEFSKRTPELLLFDEIHNIDGWERWVRKMVDLKKYQIILTGSSARMLSSELATSLTGRSLSQTIWPLSFKEYLRFQNRECQNADEYLGALREFMQWGGFPEIVLSSSDNQKTEMLRQYLTDILYKDIIKRNEIRTTRNLEQLVRFYLTNISNLHSYNSIKKAFGLNVETAREYTGFLQDAFLIFEVNRFHPNLKVQARDAKKIYVVDTGLRNANAASPHHDLGKLAENVVYIHLRRLKKEVSYFKNEGEVDFVITDFGKPKEALQVCYSDLKEEETFKRETTSLIECLQALKLTMGLILTLKREETLTIKNKTINFIPLYKWLIAYSSGNA